MKQKLISKFNCVIRAAMSREADELLSNASLEKLRKFLPEINSANDDLLPIALDACVVNRFNKNGDGIDSAMAYEIYKNFAYKPINIEHNPKNVIGTILSASFLDVNHNPLDPETAKASKDPFYITLGGVLWKRVSPNVTAYIEDCSNPLSPNYKQLSGSWELAFSDYKYVGRDDDSKEIEGCEDLKEMDYTEATRNNPTKKIYRKLIGETLPIGLGIVEYPAADVEGIATEKTTASEDTSKSNTITSVSTVIDIANPKVSTVIDVIDSKGIAEKIIEAFKEKLKCANTTLLANEISQQEKNNVTSNKSTMKISIKQITDEALKGGVITASSIQEFMNELEKANEDYKSKQAEAENLKKDSDSKRELLAAELKSAKEQLEKITSELSDIKTKLSAEAAQKAFSARMAFFDENYSLSAEVKKILAKKIGSIVTDEDFNSFKSEMEAFLTKKESTSKASEEVIDDALKNKKEGGLPNGGAKTKEDEKSELDKAFAMDQFIIKN